MSIYVFVRFRTFAGTPASGSTFALQDLSLRSGNGLSESKPPPHVVLLVEDEWLLRAEMAAGLERAGWRVIQASTGEGAIGQLRNGEQIDLLVTDIRLAGYVSGWEVAEAARSIVAGIPVIYTSGNAVDSSRKVPGSVFLSKPCVAQDVARIGGKLIESSCRDESSAN